MLHHAAHAVTDESRAREEVHGRPCAPARAVKACARRAKHRSITLRVRARRCALSQSICLRSVVAHGGRTHHTPDYGPRPYQTMDSF